MRKRLTQILGTTTAALILAALPLVSSGMQAGHSGSGSDVNVLADHGWGSPKP
ncbi:hypothetical protein AB0P12_00250 [Streptomyces subrutilus]|uniref:hypothetical protein n=1 Tax=Streptomyces subrutilus TaxID=36818 RepID=UPI0033DC0F9C